MYIACVYYSNKILEIREKKRSLLLHSVSGCLHTVYH